MFTNELYQLHNWIENDGKRLRTMKQWNSQTTSLKAWRVSLSVPFTYIGNSPFNFAFWHQKNGMWLCPEINNSDILMRRTTLSHHKAIHCTKSQNDNAQFQVLLWAELVSTLHHKKMHNSTHYSNVIANSTTQIQELLSEIMAWWLKKEKPCLSIFFCKSVQLIKCWQ